MRKKALIVGYFSSDERLIKSYNEISFALNELGMIAEGVNLGGKVDSGYSFEMAESSESFRLRDNFTSILKGLRIGSFIFLLKVLVPLETFGSGSLKVKVKAVLGLCFFRALMLRLLSSEKYSLVILNHQFSARPQVVLEVLSKFPRVKKIYWHPGFLPATFCFDAKGQMAESEVSERLKDVGVLGRDDFQEIGAEYRTWILSQNYSRPGKSSSIDEDLLSLVKERVSQAKKAILVIGSNDFRTGCLPKVFSSSDKNAGFIKSSDELYTQVLGDVPDEVLVLYKPHPNLDRLSASRNDRPENTMIVAGIPLRQLFDCVDLSVTVCSSGAYESLLYKVPCIIVGRLPGDQTGIFNRASSLMELKELVDSFSRDGSRALVREKLVNSFFGYCLLEYFYKSEHVENPFVETSCIESLKSLV